MKLTKIVDFITDFMEDTEKTRILNSVLTHVIRGEI